MIDYSYINKDIVRNANVFHLLRDVDEIYNFKENKITCGYILKSDRYLIVRLDSSNISIVNDCVNKMIKLCDTYNIKRLESDSITTTYLSLNSTFNKLFTLEEHYIATLNKNVTYDNKISFKNPKRSDYIEYFELMKLCFGGGPKIDKNKLFTEDEVKKIFVLKEDNDIICSGSVTSLTDKVAIIMAVVTHPNFQNKGLASNCVKYICSILQQNNIKPIIYFNNEKAGSVYEKIGFEKCTTKFNFINKK